MNLKQSNKKKKWILLTILSFLLITLTGTYALWNYSKTTSNQQLVAGNIYMKYKGSGNNLNVTNIMPTDTYNKNDYFEFTIEGENTHKKDIIYEIVLNHGDESDDENRTERIKDNLLKFRLVEVKEIDGTEKEEELIQSGSYADLSNKRIWIDRVTKENKENVKKTYRIYMWISKDTKIGNTEDADYDAELWNKIFASIRITVNGDLNEKELTDDYLIIHAAEIDSSNDYNLNDTPMTDEDIEVTLASKREITKFVVNKSTSEILTRSIENQEYPANYNEVSNAWEAKVVINESGVYEYYAVYPDNSNTQTYSFKININPDRYEKIDIPTKALCKQKVTYNGQTQDLIENPNQEDYTLKNYSFIDAGVHEVTATLNDKEKTRWSNGTLDDLTIECEITPKDLIIIPDSYQAKIQGADEFNLTYTYAENLEDEKPLFNGSLSRKEGDNIGYYPINLGTLTLKDNGKFKANNYKLKLTNKVVNFEITDGTPKIYIEADPLETLVNRSSKYTIKANGEGKFSATTPYGISSATFSPTSGKITTLSITGSSSGNNRELKITFTPTDSNYTSKTAITNTYKVNVYGVASYGSCRTDLVYNGENQELLDEVGDISGYGGSWMSYTDEKASTAGIHQVTAHISSNWENSYRFSNGQKTYPLNCSIAKGTPSLELNFKSVNVTTGKTVKVIANTNGYGTFKVSTQESSIATASVTSSRTKSPIVSIIGKGEGNTKLTVTFTPDDESYVNQEPITKTYDIYVSSTLPTAVSKIKDTLGKTGGVVGITTSNSKVTSASSSIREYRYSGLNVNNYITFNGEMWRILGVFTEGNIEKVKIVRNGVIPSSQVPAIYRIDGTQKVLKESSRYSTVITSASIKIAKSPLMSWLNSSGDETGYYDKFMSPYKEMIDKNSKYYLGNVNNIYSCSDRSYTGVSDNAKTAYTNERGSTLCSSTDYDSCSGGHVWPDYPATFTGAIALIYPSDYGFSSDSSYWSTALRRGSFNGRASENSWLFKSLNGSSTYLISLTSNNPRYAAAIYTSGEVETIFGENSCGGAGVSAGSVLPTLYLKSDVMIGSGTGTESDPYQLSYTGTLSTPSNVEQPSIFEKSSGNSNAKNISTIGACNNLVYNGDSQTLVSGGNNVSYSNNTKVDAGSYEIIAKANTGYKFADGSISKTLECNIDKKIIPVSFNTNTLKYNGEAQSPIAKAVGVNGETIELETTKESEIGNYTTVATMKNVNPNYTLSNTVMDYKITDDIEGSDNTIDDKTKLKINYYLMNQDMINYSLVKSKEIEVKEGENITGELINYEGYSTPKGITIKIVKGLNVIDYYYDRNIK